MATIRQMYIDALNERAKTSKYADDALRYGMPEEVAFEMMGLDEVYSGIGYHGKSAPESKKVTCRHCGQWGERETQCQHCGAPMPDGSSDAIIRWRGRF